MIHKRFMHLSIALLFSLSVLMSCATTGGARAQEPVYEPLQGTVSSVDKYGNLTTDITEAALKEKGYELGDVLLAKLGDKTVTAPFVATYSDVNRGDYLIRISHGFAAIAMSYDNCSGKTGAVEGTPVTLALSQKGAYLQEYEMRHLVKSEKREDYASDAIFANFRAVQAGSIAANRLYRGCNPVLGDARAPYAAKLVEEAKIVTVINLADSAESMAPHLAAAPYYERLVKNGQVITLNMGIDFSDPAFIAKLKDGLIFMGQHKGPFYVHCNEGKDRAGMVAAVLEALMGATVQQVADDYMLSYMNYFNVKKTDARYPVIAKIITDMFVKMNGGKAVTDANLKAVAETYLTKTVGLTAQQICALKQKIQ